MYFRERTIRMHRARGIKLLKFTVIKEETTVPKQTHIRKTMTIETMLILITANLERSWISTGNIKIWETIFNKSLLEIKTTQNS